MLQDLELRKRIGLEVGIVFSYYDYKSTWTRVQTFFDECEGMTYVLFNIHFLRYVEGIGVVERLSHSVLILAPCSIQAFNMFLSASVIPVMLPGGIISESIT